MRRPGPLLSFLSLAAALAVAGPAVSSDPVLTVTNLANLPPRDIAQLLVGCGVSITDARYSGSPSAIGKFETSGAGGQIIGFDAGLIRSTGDAGGGGGPNTVNRNTSSAATPSDDDLTAIGIALGAPAGIRTGALLQFDFIPSGATISVEYALGSEEYPEFACSNYDVIGIILNGTGLTYLPTSATTYVGITTVNSGTLSGTTFSACGSTRCAGVCGSEYFINNIIGSATLTGTAVSATRLAGTQMDGLTAVLTATGPVTPGVINRLKFVMGGDTLDDSNFFIKIGSLRSGCVPVPYVPPAPAPSTTVAATPARASLAAWPNPYRPGSGGAQDDVGVRLRPVTTGSSIRVYAAGGRLVREFREETGTGEAVWDAKNQSGRDVVSGVYLVVVEAPGGTRTRRKVVVAR